MSAHGTVKATADVISVPVVLGGKTVHPGDVVMADDDGVVVARADVGRAMAAAQARVKEAANRLPSPAASSAWIGTAFVTDSASSASSTSALLSISGKPDKPGATYATCP